MNSSEQSARKLDPDTRVLQLGCDDRPPRKMSTGIHHLRKSAWLLGQDVQGRDDPSRLHLRRKLYFHSLLIVDFYLFFLPTSPPPPCPNREGACTFPPRQGNEGSDRGASMAESKITPLSSVSSPSLVRRLPLDCAPFKQQEPPRNPDPEQKRGGKKGEGEGG